MHEHALARPHTHKHMHTSTRMQPKAVCIAPCRQPYTSVICPLCMHTVFQMVSRTVHAIFLFWHAFVVPQPFIQQKQRPTPLQYAQSSTLSSSLTRAPRPSAPVPSAPSACINTLTHIELLNELVDTQAHCSKAHAHTGDLSCRTGVKCSVVHATQHPTSAFARPFLRRLAVWVAPSSSSSELCAESRSSVALLRPTHATAFMFNNQSKDGVAEPQKNECGRLFLGRSHDYQQCELAMTDCNAPGSLYSVESMHTHWTQRHEGGVKTLQPPALRTNVESSPCTLCTGADNEQMGLQGPGLMQVEALSQQKKLWFVKILQRATTRYTSAVSLTIFELGPAPGLCARSWGLALFAL